MHGRNTPGSEFVPAPQLSPPVVVAPVRMAPSRRVVASHVDVAALARKAWDAGDVLFRKGDFQAAIGRFREAIRLMPQDPGHHLYLGCALWQTGDVRCVEEHLLKSVALGPNYPSVHQILSAWYIEKGLFDQAEVHSRTAMRLRPDIIQFQVSHANVLWAQDNKTQAWDLIRPLIGTGQESALLARTFGKIAPEFGQEELALSVIQRSLRSPDVTCADIARLHYVAAGLLDGIGRFDEAFEQARLANETANRKFDSAAESRFFHQRMAYYTKQQLAALPRATHGSRRPVLVIGMPRSGTSLVEQILASHPEVYGAGELLGLSEAALAEATAGWPTSDQFPQRWNHLTLSRANELAGGYLKHLNDLNSTARYVVDKMPQNFLSLGNAQLLVPQCKVIHCTRDPRDTCISCYFTDFSSGLGFSFNISHLAAYYRDYVRIMEHWKEVLTLPILDVSYEKMIADPAGQTRRILKFLDLPWDDGCMKYHENKRNVATASREQVRKPIYSTSVGRWKHYEKHIPELMALVK